MRRFNMRRVGTLDKGTTRIGPCPISDWPVDAEGKSSSRVLPAFGPDVERQLHRRRLGPVGRGQLPDANCLEQTRLKVAIVETRLSDVGPLDRAVGSDLQFEDGASRQIGRFAASSTSAVINSRAMPTCSLNHGSGTQSPRNAGLLEPHARPLVIGRMGESRIAVPFVRGVLASRRRRRARLSSIRCTATHDTRADQRGDRHPPQTIPTLEDACAQFIRHQPSPCTQSSHYERAALLERRLSRSNRFDVLLTNPPPTIFIHPGRAGGDRLTSKSGEPQARSERHPV